MTNLTSRIYDVLANEKQREILTELLESSLEIQDLIERTDRELHAQIEYRHVHLPKLDDYGFITWDPTSDRVKKGPEFEKVKPVLKTMTGNENDLLSTD